MNQFQTTKVLIVEDHPLAQAGLRNFVEAFPDLVFLGAVDSGEQALAFCESEEPDVVLMDLRMRGMGGVAATRALKEGHPKVQVIALTSSHEGELMREALRANDIGYLVTSATTVALAHTIRDAEVRQ